MFHTTANPIIHIIAILLCLLLIRHYQTPTCPRVRPGAIVGGCVGVACWLAKRILRRVKLKQI